LAFFQVEEILDIYLKGDAPDWIRNAVTQLGWLFESYPRTAVFLNVATELMFDFVIDNEIQLEEHDLKEFNFTGASPNKVLKVLREALIINTANGKIYPGALIEEITKLRLTKLKLKSHEFQEKVREVRGVLSVALTLGIIKVGQIRPKKPLAVFRILAQNIINSGLSSDMINKTLSDIGFENACISITPRQRRRMKWHLSGFSTGHPYIIEDIDDDMNMVFDEDIVFYMENIRERYRERQRSRFR
jgi:hypothetical protein